MKKTSVGRKQEAVLFKNINSPLESKATNNLGKSNHAKKSSFADTKSLATSTTTNKIRSLLDSKGMKNFASTATLMTTKNL